MYTELIIYGVCIWLLVGARGFIHYRLKQYTITKSELILIVLAAVQGPFAWPITKAAMKEPSIFSKRQQKNRDAQCNCEFCKRDRM